MTNNDNMTLDAVLENMNQELNEKIERISKARQITNEQKKATTINDTRIGYVMASRDFIASASLVISEGANSLEMTPAQKGKWSGKVNVIAGIGNMIKKEFDKKEGGKKNLIIYTQDTEARRVSGMISRLRDGSNEYLTKKELDYIMSREDMGETYRLAAQSLFGLLKLTMDNGFNIRVTGSDSLNGFQITNRDLPEKIENQVLSFRNGVARFGDRFVNVSGLKLNGNHRLIKNDGRFMVERKIDKDKNPEAFYALQLLQIISKSISVAADNIENEDVAATAA